jgi:glucose-1-phosphate adenylyltransferase
MLPPTKLSNTHLEKSIVADGCIINAKHITHSLIGIRTRIGFDTEIESCYVMGSDNYQTLEDIADAKEAGEPIMGIGDRCCIKNAIIDKNTYIGDDVTINCADVLPDGDFPTYTVTDGIVIVKKRAVIPNGTVI